MAIGGVDGFRHIDDIVGELLVLRIEGAVGVAHGVVADDDWMDAVTAVPVRMPLRGLLVILPRMARILLPATFCKPSLINFMAKRNTASAPAKLTIINRMSVKCIKSIGLIVVQKYKKRYT